MSILSAAFSGLGLKGIAIASAVAFTFGATSGTIVTRKFYVAAEERQQIINLQTQMAAKDAAYKANADALVATQGKLNVLDGVVDGLQKKISTGDCFVGDDVDAVRDLLGQSRSATNPR